MARMGSLVGGGVVGAGVVAVGIGASGMRQPTSEEAPDLAPAARDVELVPPSALDQNHLPLVSVPSGPVLAPTIAERFLHGTEGAPQHMAPGLSVPHETINSPIPGALHAQIMALREMRLNTLGIDPDTPAAPPLEPAIVKVTLDAYHFNMYLNNVQRAVQDIGDALVRREGYRKADIFGRGEFSLGDVRAILIHYPPSVTDPATGFPVKPLIVEGPQGQELRPINFLAEKEGGRIEAQMRDRSSPAAQQALRRFFDATTPERYMAAIQELEQILRGDPALEAAKSDFTTFWIDRSADSARQLHELLQHRPGELINADAVVGLLRAEFEDYGSLDRMRSEFELTYPSERFSEKFVRLPDQHRAYARGLEQGHDILEIVGTFNADPGMGVQKLIAFEAGTAHLDPSLFEDRINGVKLVRGRYKLENNVELRDAVHLYFGTPELQGSRAHIEALAAILLPEGAAVNRALSDGDANAASTVLLSHSPIEREAILLAATLVDRDGRSAGTLAQVHLTDAEMIEFSYARTGIAPHRIGDREMLPHQAIDEVLAASENRFTKLRQLLISLNAEQAGATLLAWNATHPGEDLVVAIEQKAALEQDKMERELGLGAALNLRAIQIIEGLRLNQFDMTHTALMREGRPLPEEHAAKVVKNFESISQRPFESRITAEIGSASDRAALRFLARGTDIRKDQMSGAELDAVHTRAKEIYGESAYTAAQALLGVVGEERPRDVDGVKVLGTVPSAELPAVYECATALIGAPRDVALVDLLKAKGLTQTALMLQ